MDPVLAARLARQHEKVISGKSDVEMRFGEKKVVTQKSELAQRFARQQAKLNNGEGAVESIGAAKKHNTQMDPKLASMLARQLEKAANGETDVDRVCDGKKVETQIDPVLAQRLAKQREKASVCEEEVTSVASPTRSRRRSMGCNVVDTVLAQRLAQQLAKSEGLTQLAVQQDLEPKESPSDDACGTSLTLETEGSNCQDALTTPDPLLEVEGSIGQNAPSTPDPLLQPSYPADLFETIAHTRKPCNVRVASQSIQRGDVFIGCFATSVIIAMIAILWPWFSKS